MNRLYTLRNILLVAMAMLSLAAGARTFGNETLNYEIVYHWGAVWKHAGDATLTLRKSGSGYKATLVGKSRPWADKVYTVRYTLTTTLNASMIPQRYEKRSHENGHFSHDVVQYSYSGSKTSATCKRYRTGKPVQTISLSTSGQAYDLVSVFYMLRSLNLQSMTKGKSYVSTIFSGKRKETLTIVYKGMENVKMRNGKTRQAHHLVMRFTQDGGKRSSDDIDSWFSTDEARLPLLVVGKLAVGEIKCYYTGA